MQTCRQPACAVTRSRAASIVACSGRYVRGSGRSMFALRCCGKCATTIARGRINQPIDRCRVNAERDELSSATRSEEHTSELQSHHDLVCRLLLEKKNA